MRFTSAEISEEPGSALAINRAATLTPWPNKSPFG
jgi:hypothetical protein